MLRKFAISVAILGISSDAVGKIVFAFLVLLISMLFQSIVRPYRSALHNELEIRVHSFLLVLLFTATVFINPNLNSDIDAGMAVIGLLSILCVLVTAVHESVRIVLYFKKMSGSMRVEDFVPTAQKIVLNV
eukprot:TRINITY_DN4208_c0_g1_i8.p1 TRINITY_DN4208_c0_g1~~TRINITY_DN4208_c0_g1_i8.p1  ORF type:complete len:131 (-),score=34.83 TRINITY_DN4208_c0_g1_i8:174-566(-)